MFHLMVYHGGVHMVILPVGTIPLSADPKVLFVPCYLLVSATFFRLIIGFLLFLLFFLFFIFFGNISFLVIFVLLYFFKSI